MFKIVEKSQYSEKVFKLVVEAPLIAKSRRAGHFVIIRTDAQGERIPLTIAEADARRGTITLVVQAVGLSSAKLTQMQVGDSLADIVGPLGRATHIENFGTVVCAGGGVGVAPMLPIVQALKAAGNRVIVVLAGRTKELIIMEEEMRQSSDEVIIMTDDGSYGSKGLVTQGIEQVIQREKVDKCFAIGPAVMMKFCCLLTKKYNIPTDVSLNTIMVDGTGMCGACRVTVGGKTKFVCVDGPEFDGHEVDFDEMMQRLGAFKSEEREAIEAWEKAQADSAATASTASEDEEKCMDSSCETLTAPIGIAPEGEGRDAAWRVELRSAMKPKERMAVARQEMAELDAATRSHELREEVQRGLTAQQAMTEATRCLDCANPGCVTGCPVGIDIPAFVKLIEKGAFVAAARSIKKQSSLPAVCGRVCPQEKQCESRCIHLKTGGKPVAIGYLERFAADQERIAAQCGNVQPQSETNEPTTAKKQKVAIVGSGPAGLTCAGDLARRGYSVTVFEALHELGGVLKYGIPEYRLPNDIVDFEIENLRTQGVEFVKDCIVGKTITVEQLQAEGYSAIFVGSGAGLPNFMGIPGENATGILSSNEYLTRVNLMDASNPNADTPVPFAKRVAVVGGGNTAMDSVRTARRLGAEEAFIIYRRSEQEMPARLEEVRHAKEEGVKFLTLCNPLEYISDEQGHVRQVVLQKMQLGEPDASGRRRPEPIPGATETLDVDLVIVAIGVSPNPIVPASLPALEQGRKGTIAVNDDMQSSIPTLFAGGDIVRGGATVILAMGDGKHAAESIDKMLSGEQE
ncbi:MAG: bifunctional dihydroorotate dehydrogenase B NAD binding subunit/NADPH-dependent glutamate synthase [Bacteroidaceae bacterium]|nr:bifunctional dihydroorotate dehydrogenase B NAD binding subunit/NADPH-dependent glutamate synthase [Bacteroidaceae bacterium]